MLHDDSGLGATGTMAVSGGNSVMPVIWVAYAKRGGAGRQVCMVCMGSPKCLAPSLMMIVGRSLMPTLDACRVQ